MINNDIITTITSEEQRCRGAVGRVSSLRSRGRGFESRPGTPCKNSGQVSHTYVPLSPSSIFGTGLRAVMPCGWGVKAGVVRVWAAGKTV